MKLYRRLFSYTRPYRAVFAFAILGMLLVASTDVMMLQLVRPMINDMGQVDADRGRWLAFLIVGVFVLMVYLIFAMTLYLLPPRVQ